MKREIVISKNAESLTQAAAEEILEIGNTAIQAHGRFSIALSGGTTPRAVYTLLATEPFKSKINWNKVHVFWSDERSVIPSHPDSNYRMAKEALLSKINIPEENIHRVTSEEDALLASGAYEEELNDFFHLLSGDLPVFDLIMLGLGDDGHTASLFPGTEALHETKSLVADNFVKKLSTHRITFTFPVINNAAHVLFLVSGPTKTKMLKRVLENTEPQEILPSQMVIPAHGRLLWMLDEAAAAELKR
jgi:6-phosphogluconolactonase